MTKYWVIQFNKKCAEFLGVLYGIRQDGAVKEESKVRIHKILNLDETEGLHINHCKFHSDWNWIMEVVEKIGSNVKISKGYCRIITFSFDITINAETKEAVIQAIDQFIDWYNKHKKS